MPNVPEHRAGPDEGFQMIEHADLEEWNKATIRKLSADKYDLPVLADGEANGSNEGWHRLV